MEGINSFIESSSKQRHIIVASKGSSKLFTFLGFPYPFFFLSNMLLAISGGFGARLFECPFGMHFWIPFFWLGLGSFFFVPSSLIFIVVEFSLHLIMEL